MRAYLRLTLPLMVGLTMTFSTEFLLRFFGSYLPEGSIAVLNFSLRVMLMAPCPSGNGGRGTSGRSASTNSCPAFSPTSSENH